MDRRSFIRISSFSAGAWLLSETTPIALAQGPARLSEFRPSPLIRLGADGSITLYVMKQEMGQGVRTSMPILLAEELDADYARITVAPLPYDASIANQFNTWASASIRGGWGPLRKAGAAARSMLATAAAAQWNVSLGRVKTVDSTVVNLDTHASLPYSALIEAASKLPVPANPELKHPRDFKLIGKAVARQDVRDKVSGRQQFAIDMTLPGMLVATVVRSPTFYGKVRSFDDRQVRALGPGIVAVLEVKQLTGLDNRNGVAIVATSTWLALKGQSLLKVSWDAGEVPNANSATLSGSLKAALGQDTPALTYDGTGKSKDFSPLSGPAVFSAEYELPFLNQAPLEPLNCIASWKDGKFEVWGGFQAPAFFASAAAKAFELDKSAIFVHLAPMGGAFGRKEKIDNAAEAMQLAKALGKPVKLVFSRPDEMRNSFYRPATFHKLSALAGKQGIKGWRHQVGVACFPGKTIVSPHDIYGGPSNDLVYPVDDYQSGFYPVASPIPTGSWRSISYSQNVFAVECFIDELAAHQKMDAVQFRLNLLRQHGADERLASHRKRMEAVLVRCADAIGWGKPAVRGRFRGVACCVYTHTHAYTAHAFEVSVSPRNVVTIHKVVCVVDCGVVVDPSGFRAQIEGSLVWGLSAALGGDISVKDGVVEQQNFSDYEVVRMRHSPPMELIVIDSAESPAGAGEPAVPSVAPALCNAIAAANKGKRVRKLPLVKAGYTFA